MGRPRRRLFDVLQQRSYGLTSPTDLHTASKDCAGFVERLSLSHHLPAHNGCVNSICWNATGTLLLSGSDDHHLKLTEPYTAQIVVDYKTAHRANIFSAKFLPFSNDAKIISCSGDGAVLFTDLQDRPCESAGRPAHLYLCPAGTTYEVLTWETEPQSFLSCGEEGAVRCYDLRQHRACSVRGCTETVLLWADRAVTTMALNPASLWELAVATADGSVSLYDRRMLQPQQNGGALRQWSAPGLQGAARRITAIRYAPGGQQLLVSYSADDVYLFDLSELEAPAEPGAAAATPTRPPVKRLRLRGDWSDTGPQARPERLGAAAGERERVAEEQRGTHEQAGNEARPRRPGVSLHASLINQMSDVLQRLLTSEMPSRPVGMAPAPAPSWPPALPPDLSRRPVTRRVMERIRQRRALNMEQMVQGMESLHTSDESESAAGTSDVSTEPANGADVGSPAVRAADAGAESPPDAEGGQTAAAGGAATEDTSAGGAADSDQTPVGGETDDEGRGEASAAASAAMDNANSACGATDAADTKDGAPVATDKTGGALVATDTSGGAAASADDLGGAAVSEGAVSAAVAPPPLGPYLDLETESVVVCSEPLVSLYYNPQSSTAGQISVESPHSAPPLFARQADTEACRPTFAERALLLSCGSAQEPDGPDPDYPDEPEEPDDEEQEEAEACRRRSCSDRHQQPRVIARYTGHRNARTMIKEANFWGSDHVLSGSDCGHVFIWDRHTARLVAVLEADRHVVNCVQPHPLDPLLATSGIDYDVKLWAPLAPQSTLDPQRAEELMTRNAIMLEETRDTITVPASFMIRMLASLSSRRGR